MPGSLQLLARHVPVDRLRETLARRRIFVDEEADSYTLAEAAHRLGHEGVWSLIDELLTFGRGSVWWFQADRIDIETMRSLFRTHLGFDPFVTEPKITPQETPQIASAYTRPDGRVLILTVYGRERPIVTTDGVVRQVEAVYTPIVVRPNSGVVEVWGSQESARAANDALHIAMGFLPRPPIRLADELVTDLIASLGARLVQRKVKDNTGQGVDYIEMKKALDTEDLRSASRYLGTDFGKLPGMRDIIEFQGPGNRRVTMAIAWNGAFVFRQFVPQEVVDYVFSKVVELLGEPARAT